VQVCGDDGTYQACQCSTADGGSGPTSTSTTGAGGATGGGGSGGSCTPPMELCGGDCVDTQTSSEHCGACDDACPDNGTTCEGGDCVCLGGLALCDTSCIPVDADPSNCGDCAHDCLGAACNGGVCDPELLVQLGGSDEPYALAVDATHVYVGIDGPQPRIGRVPLDGGSLVTTNAQGPRALALDGTFLYFTDFGVLDSGRVMRVDTLDFNGAQQVVIDDQPAGVWGLDVDAGFAYWGNQNANTVARVPVGGPPVPQPLASLQSRPWEVAVDGAHVYWTNYDSGDVRRVPVGGGMANILASAQAHPLGLAVDVLYVYWSNETSGEIMRADLDGDNEIVLATGQSQPTYLAVAGPHVYWTNFGNGTVMRLDTASGSLIPLAVGQSQPYDLALDATHVYWTTLGGRTVMRVPR
jgi:hypothetical protein